MADRPIIFSAPMVRALLDGRKTQTRRIAPVRRGLTLQDLIDNGDRDGKTIRATRAMLAEPRYAAGDRLYVREAHALVPMTAYRASTGVEQTINPRDPDEAAIYALGWERSKPRWRPSIHMPRWASRLTLLVDDVRVERLNDISEADAAAEGVIWEEPDPAAIRECQDLGLGVPDGVWLAPGTRMGFGPRKDDPQWGPTAAFAFRLLWESIHGNGSWAENPWVVAITFRVERGNIDATSETSSVEGR